MEQTTVIYLLSIPGRLAPKSLEDARNVHNSTAGAPPNVAAAKSLGDLSHMVYAPLGQVAGDASNFLILDLWNSMEGLNTFFANKQVQEQAGEIFRQRDPVIWAPAEGFRGYHIPAPFGKNERYIGIVRGMVRSRADGQKRHNALVDGAINKARAAGHLSHEAYFRLSPPGAPESLEFFAVDVWMSAAGMGQYYADPEFMRGFQEMFAGPPSSSVWVHPTGEWVEW